MFSTEDFYGADFYFPEQEDTPEEVLELLEDERYVDYEDTDTFHVHTIRGDIFRDVLHRIDKNDYLATVYYGRGEHRPHTRFLNQNDLNDEEAKV